MLEESPLAPEAVEVQPPQLAGEPRRGLGDDGWEDLTNSLRGRLTMAVGGLLRAILKRNENPGYAEDIVNETLAAVYQKRLRYDPGRGRLYPWLLRIAKNKAYDFLRRHRELKSERSFDEGFDSPQPDSERELLYESAATPDARTLALRRALKRLRPHDQEVLIGRFGNALDYDELERYFDFTVSKSTLRVHVRRAQARLRRELAKEPIFRELFDE